MDALRTPQPRTLRDIARLVGRAALASPLALGGGVVLALGQGALAGAAVAALRLVVNAAVGTGSGALGLPPALALWGLCLLGGVLCGHARQQLAEQAQQRVREAFNREFLEAAARLPYEDFERPAVTALLERAEGVLGGTGVYDWIRDTLESLGQLAQLGAVGGVLLGLSPWLAVPTVLAIGLQYTLEAALVRRRFETSRRTSGLRRFAGYLEGLLTDRGVNAEARVHGAARWLIARWARAQRLADAQENLQVRRQLGRDVAVRGSTLLVYAGALVFGVALALAGRLDAGGIVALAAGVRSIQEAAEEIGYQLSGAQERWLHLSDAVRLLSRTRGPSGPPPLTAAGRITLRDVWYRYPGARRDALAGVDLELRRGELLALVGPNGSGKSTVAKVLLGLLPPARGTLEGDGPDPVTRSAVFQDFMRYELTLRENVGLGRIAALRDDAALGEALAAAGADAVLARGGLDGQLGRAFAGGLDLSAGQWQAVAGARGAFARGDLLVLDEPTAALDPLAERAAFERFAALARGRFAVILTHRMGAAALAARIAVMRAGTVVEHGTHAELVAAGGLYARMWEAQARWYR